MTYKTKLKEINERNQTPVVFYSDLSHLEDSNVLYIAGHGRAGLDGIWNEGVSVNSVKLADTLINQLHLPANVAVRVISCDSGNGSSEEIEIPSCVYNVGNCQKADYIISKSGDFFNSFAGILERELIKLQPSRRIGSVAGYVGSLASLAENKLLKKYAQNRKKEFSETTKHNVSSFSSRNTDGKEIFINFRRKNLRCTAQERPFLSRI